MGQISQFQIYITDTAAAAITTTKSWEKSPEIFLSYPHSLKDYTTLPSFIPSKSFRKEEISLCSRTNLPLGARKVLSFKKSQRIKSELPNWVAGAHIVVKSVCVGGTPFSRRGAGPQGRWLPWLQHFHRVFHGWPTILPYFVLPGREKHWKEEH